MSAKILHLDQYRIQRLRDQKALDRAKYLIEVLEIMSRSGIPIADAFKFEIPGDENGQHPKPDQSS